MPFFALHALTAHAFFIVALGAEPTLPTRLALLEDQHQALCPSPEGAASFLDSVSSLHKELAQALESKTDGRARVEALNRIVFERTRIKASTDLKDPCNLLPSRIIERKHGYCVGIAALYLSLAEGLGIPIYAVATPSHVFIRYDDGTTRINIETLRGGASIPDEQYVREEKIPQRAISRGVFMRNLATDEFLAQVHNNLGVIYSERGDRDSAAREYETALGLDRRLPAAYYNYGNELLKQGAFHHAERMFSRAIGLWATDPWALNNRGLAHEGLANRRRAMRDFQRALEVDSGFGPARANLERLSTPHRGAANRSVGGGVR